MAGLLGDIYSYGDTLKRKVNGLLADPRGTLEQFVGQLGDQANQTSDLMNQAGWMPIAKTNATKEQQAMARALLAEQGTEQGSMAGMISGGRLPFLKKAEEAYTNNIPQTALDSAGRSWNVRVGNSIDGITFEKNGRVFGVNRDPMQQYYADNGHRNVANSIYAMQDEKNAARALHAELMAPQAPVQLPQWASNLTRPQNTSAAGADWWNASLRNKSNASFEAFADAAKDTPLMLYGKGSGALSASDVAAAYPGISTKQNGGDLLFSGKNGGLMVFGANTEAPVIRSTGAGSKGKENGGGKELYQAAYNWASNNGKVIAPDSGITDINELRKLGNVLSAQIRGGKPVADMNAGGLLGQQGVPQLWQAEAKLATKRAPEIKSLKFDGTQFNMPDADLLHMLSKSDPSFNRGVGVMTAKRAALSTWLKSATPDQAKKAAAALAAAGSGAVFAKPKD